jgi:hypothetical protein
MIPNSVVMMMMILLLAGRSDLSCGVVAQSVSSPSTPSLPSSSSIAETRMFVSKTMRDTICVTTVLVSL